MKHALLRYGLISAGILIGVNVVVLLITGIPGPEDYALGEVIGYATIIVALVPVFFAVKHYRDEVAGGTIGFWRGIGVGLAVSAFPSMAFALYNFVYVKWLDPDFTEKYYQYSLDKVRDEMSAAEFQQYAAEVEAQSAMFTDPVVMTIVMFLTVFLIGLVVAIISALVLRRNAVTATG